MVSLKKILLTFIRPCNKKISCDSSKSKQAGLLNTLLGLFLSFIIYPFSFSYAAEGMWILPNVPDSVPNAMEEMGMDIDIDAVYSEKSNSLKDVTAYITSGYTGTVISEKGLMIAPYEAVLNHLPDSIDASKEYNSPSIYKEIPLQGLEAWILKSTQNITFKILSNLQGITKNDERKAIVDSVTKVIYRSEVIPYNHTVRIVETSTGDFYLYTYKCFKDVRLVYLPPSTLANKELEKERHSAHFALMRIYSNRENEPSAYNNTNKPYSCSNPVLISVNKYKEGNFVFAYGYPNKTARQTLSASINENDILKTEASIKVLSLLDTLEYKKCEKRIEKLEREIAQVKNSGIIEAKAEQEMNFTIWAANSRNFNHVLRYANVITKINTLFKQREQFVKRYIYLQTLIREVSSLNAANLLLEMNDDNEEASFEELNNHFVNLNIDKEKKMLSKALDFIKAETDSVIYTPIFETEQKKYKGNRDKYFKDIFDKSLLTSDKRYMKYLDSPTEVALQADILVDLTQKISKACKSYYLLALENNAEIEHLTQLYKEGMAFFKPSLRGTPDANYTLRMSYGTIAGYSPDDVTVVNATSEIDGMFKYSPQHPKAEVDTLLAELYKTNAEVARIRTTFLIDCDMASGRTGYGVYDYNGELLGIVIGHNHEATDNIYVYNKEYQRLVVLDINYVTFLMKNYAKVDYIEDEFKFGKPEKIVKIESVKAKRDE